MISELSKFCSSCGVLFYKKDSKPNRFHLQKYCSKKCKQKEIDERRKNNPKRIQSRRKSGLKYRNKNLEKRRKLYRDWSKTPNGRKLRRISAISRHKRVKKCTPKWVNKDEIVEIYKKCQEMNNGSYTYNVDHIWPINGKDSCGLHVPWNLRIVKVEENSSKNNKNPNENTI